MAGQQGDVTQVLDLGLDSGSAAANLAPQALNLAPTPSAQAPRQLPLQVQSNMPPTFGQAGAPLDFGGTNLNNPTIGLRPVVTQDVHIVSRRMSSALMQALGATVLVVGLVLGYVWFTTGDIANIMDVIGLSDSGAQVALQTPGPRPKPKKPAIDRKNTPAVASPEKNTSAVASPAKLSAAAQAKTDAESIWGFMKNDLGGELMEAGQALTADQEATFKAGLDHEFNYQRYKTILDLAAARAPGSEEMLREALESKKFWTRMRAIIALADMGEELTDDDIKQALGRTHSELRANFFKRFERSTCTVGCYFVARASLPHLDAAGRAQVIRVISKEASDIRDTYLVAATKDQSPTVRKEAEAWLAEHAVDQAVYDDIKRIYGAPN